MSPTPSAGSPPLPETGDPAGEDTNRHFHTAHLMPDLRGRSIRGGVVTLVAQGLKFILQLASTAILGRLLLPEEFGLVAMVTAITGFVAMFKDAGLSMATVQSEHITHAQVSTLFWVNVALSVVLMAVTAALAPAISWFYGEPRLTGITLALAAAYIFGGLTVQHQALIQRQMRFTALSGIAVASFAASVVAAVAAALYGLGYWSVVIMTVAGAAVNAALVWLFSGWRPGLPVRGSGVMPMLKFGGNLTGASLLNYASRNVDNILIAYFWGTAAIGLYSRSYALFQAPLRQLSAPFQSVTAPMLSRLAADEERYGKVALLLLRACAIAGAGAAVFVVLFANEIVAVLLGPQWTEAVPIIRWLSMAIFTQVALMGGQNIIVARGRADVYLRYTIFNTSVAIGSFVIGLPWGPTGVAAAYSLTGLFFRAPALVGALDRAGCVTKRAFYTQVGPIILVSGMVALAGLGMRIALMDWLALGTVPMCLALGGYMLAASLLMYFAVPGVRQTLGDAQRLLRGARNDS